MMKEDSPMYDFFRQFKVLKLIRDGIVTNYNDFKCVPTSHYFYEISQFLDDIKELGIIVFG